MDKKKKERYALQLYRLSPAANEGNKETGPKVLKLKNDFYSLALFAFFHKTEREMNLVQKINEYRKQGEQSETNSELNQMLNEAYTRRMNNIMILMKLFFIFTA